MGETIRLNKLIAQRGVTSRRDAEAWIAEGRVTVNGQVVSRLGTVVDATTDEVRIDGQRLPAPPSPIYLLMYKPRGYLTGRDDPEGRDGVHKLLPEGLDRVEPVGRLDFDTEGALLLTNDGDLAHMLLHPSRGIPRRYLVKIYRAPSESELKMITEGRVFLDDGPSPPARVRVVSSTGTGNTWVEITLTEGRNRIVRRLFAQLGHPVSKLRRESFATISIRGMERGQVRALTGEEVARLRDLASGIVPKRAGQKKYKPGFARPKPKPGRVRKQKPPVVPDEP
jgi:23S rRNA pseudouridine2605 synthase